MNPVVEVIWYYENLNSVMETKTPQARTAPSNSRRLKRITSDFTEIKRPLSRQKILTDNDARKCSTLPRTNATHHRTKSSSDNENTAKRREDRARNLDEKTATPKSEQQGRDPALEQAANPYFGKVLEEIEEKVLRFNKNFQEKRTLFQKHNAVTRVENHKGESSVGQGFSSESSVEASAGKNYMILKTEDDLSDDNEQEYIFDITETTDDIYGFNTFDKNEENNFILETYNRHGGELVITTLQIKRENYINKRRDRINYILQELIQTEEQYIKVLKLVVNEYIPYIAKYTPQYLIGKNSYIFGNIEEIYKNAEEFLKSMKECTKTANNIAEIFIKNAPEFELYPYYSRNKPTADVYLKQFDEVVQQAQLHLKDKLGLASHLLTPIQRLGKYVLLLEEIQSELSKTGTPSQKIDDAISVVRKVMKTGNDYIAVDSIKHSVIDLTLQGSFIKRSLFHIVKPKRFTSMVFLFENAVIFTESVTRNPEEFRYVDGILMSDLKLGEFEEKPTIFHLTDYTKSKVCGFDNTYILDAESKRMKDEWIKAIRKKLWAQLVRAKKAQEKEMGCLKDQPHSFKDPAPPSPRT